MRAHNVPMLDPDRNGSILYDAPTTPMTVIRKAQQACNHFLPAGRTLSPQQHAKLLGQMVKFVNCMLARHQPVQLLNRGGGVGYAVPQGGAVNPNSPLFKAAEATCTKQHLRTS